MERRRWALAVPLLVAEVTLLIMGSPLAALLPVVFLVGVLAVGSRDPALMLACMGLVTVSWDRVSVRFGGMTLKPAFVLFVFALLVDFLGRRARVRSTGRVWVLRGAVVAFMGLLVVATVNGGYVVDGARQMVAVALGGLVPAWACFRIGQSPERRAVLISWALAGAGLVAAWGIYQFAASYLDLPTVLAYTGSTGGLNRAAALSYEPAYFAMYLVSLIPVTVALVARPRSERSIRTAPRLLLCLLVIGVVVSNARAGYIALPFALLLPGIARRSTVRARPVAIAGASVVFCLALSTVSGFDAVGFAKDRLASVTDTEDVASNRPRILLYRTGWAIASRHRALGIGPGALGHYLPVYGLPAHVMDPDRAVANNIWLQALLDGGVLGPVLVVLILTVIYHVSRRSPDPHARWLALGALLVLVIGGMLTSIFWDAKYWTLIGLALAADLRPMPTSAPERVGAAT